MLTILIGIASSIVTELVIWLDKKFFGTPLQGDGAFVMAAVIALIASVAKLYLVPTVTFQIFFAGFAGIWATSQVFYLGVIQLFGLNVKSPGYSQ